jgi:hypothetical protein
LKTSATAQTKHWISNFVIRHNLCPFAKFPFDQDEIYYCELEDLSIPEYLEALFEHCKFVNESTEFSTGFVIFNAPTVDFELLLDIQMLALDLLEQSELAGVFQLVPFHPQFRFQDSDTESPMNRVNQSPFPMLHILAEDDVTRAKEEYGVTQEILTNNQETLKRIADDIELDN